MRRKRDYVKELFANLISKNTEFLYGLQNVFVYSKVTCKLSTASITQLYSMVEKRGSQLSLI
jgi:hypothetical protein